MTRSDRIPARRRISMELLATSGDLDKLLASTETAEGHPISVTDPARFRAEVVDSLVWSAVFAKGDAREAARRAIREAALSLGILPASIFPLYEARGRGEISGFTVPAINARILTYDTVRAALRAALRINASAIIFEIARSEVGYTDQRPGEAAPVVLADAIRGGWQSASLLPGDHYQTNPSKMKEDAEKEVSAIEALIEEAMPVGYLQIDIDASTLVDLSKPTVSEQQRANSEYCARFTKFIRQKEPNSVPI